MGNKSLDNPSDESVDFCSQVSISGELEVCDIFLHGIMVVQLEDAAPECCSSVNALISNFANGIAFETADVLAVCCVPDCISGLMARPALMMMLENSGFSPEDLCRLPLP